MSPIFLSTVFSHGKRNWRREMCVQSSLSAFRVWVAFAARQRSFFRDFVNSATNTTQFSSTMKSRVATVVQASYGYEELRSNVSIVEPETLLHQVISLWRRKRVTTITSMRSHVCH